MDIETSPECLVKHFDNIQARNVTAVQSNYMVPQQLSYLISLEQPDGSSQIVQLNEQQAGVLGIFPNEQPILEETVDIKLSSPYYKNLNNTGTTYNKIININKDTEGTKPLGSCENPIEIIKDGEVLHSTQNLSDDYLKQIAQALQFQNIKLEKDQKELQPDPSSNIVYRVVYPEELNLKPEPPKSVKRGRPKRKPCLDEKPDISTDVTPVKNVRTRSGRITRPPQYIQKDFKKIDTSEVDGMETDLKIIEFEPLKTNQSPTTSDVPVQINQLELHQRKRCIAPQFRCPKCKKAYLGHSKMLKHLQKHPDHGPIPEHCKSRYNDTWNYLIDIANKRPSGQKGIKFCRELVNFLSNVRVLAKMFFKHPSGNENNLYYVDETFAELLGIQSGNYVLNENELHKDLHIYSFLNSSTQPNDIEKDVTFKNTETNQNAKDNSNASLHVTNQTSQSTNSNDKTNNPVVIKIENQVEQETEEINDFTLKCDVHEKSFDSEMNKLSNGYNNNDNEEVRMSTCERLPEAVKPNTSDLTLPSDLLSENCLLNSLPNLRTSVEELILNNVDTGHVTNMLENSASSDEVINVDQFVNERFKNLTESDLELPNTTLNLDSLELFQFHSS